MTLSIQQRISIYVYRYFEHGHSILLLSDQHFLLTIALRTRTD